MTKLRIYCTDSEKETIKQSAKAEGLTISSYLLRKAKNDLYERAMLVELVMLMIQLIEAQVVGEEVKDDLRAIAQSVLDGEAISEARERISEVCRLADQSDQRR